MKIEKFKVIEYIRQLLIMIDVELENFPKKDIELKNRIKNNSYDILELAYQANSLEETRRKGENSTYSNCKNKNNRFFIKSIIR